MDILLKNLFQLRLLVARYGEMDCAKWWNTQGMLGNFGNMLFKRGFPRSHLFAQARIVFAVARDRCNKVFHQPNSTTLWNMPAQIEFQLAIQWSGWLDDAEGWASVFKKVESLKVGELLATMQDMELASPSHAAAAANLRRSAEGRAVPVGAVERLHDDAVTMLAAAFSRGQAGQLAVPYARIGASL